MKRNLLYFILCVNLLASMTGCYDDQSTEASIVIPEIEIDTTGIKSELAVTRYQRLQLNPSVSKEGTDPSDLSYKWMLSLAPVTFATTSFKEDRYLCIGEEMTLDAEITRDDNETPYRLWYQVTDNTTGLRKDIVWDLRVKAPYGEGLLIAESHDNGTTADFALIEGERFTVDYEEGTTPKITHNLFSKANEGQKINSDVTQVCAFRCKLKSPYIKYFGLIGEGEDKYLLMDKNYKVLFRNEEGFFDGALEDELKPTQIFSFNGRYYTIITNGYLHGIDLEGTDSYDMKWGMPFKNSQVGRYAAVGSHLGVGYFNYPSWHLSYDPIKGAFYSILNQVWQPHQAFYMACSGTVGNINLANCPNLETVATGLAAGDWAYLLMRNKETGKYFIVGQGKYDTAPKRYYSIPDCELDNAISYAVSDKGNVFYFATKTDVWAIQLQSDPVRVVNIYSAEDEITHMSFLRQAKTTTDYYSPDLITSSYLMLIATYDGSKGKLTTIPLLNTSTGELDASLVESYEGFGKILTTVHQYP